MHFHTRVAVSSLRRLEFESVACMRTAQYARDHGGTAAPKATSIDEKFKAFHLVTAAAAEQIQFMGPFRASEMIQNTLSCKIEKVY